VRLKCFSFRKCNVILIGRESYVVSNYSQYYQEERRGKIELINFVILHRNFFFLCVQALRPLLEKDSVTFLISFRYCFLILRARNT